MARYDNPCRSCGGNGQDDEDGICPTCDGYGYLLTNDGHELIEFLKRRGYGEPMSPRAESELSECLE